MSTKDLKAQLAPWPAIDRIPIIIGSNLTFSYLASASRLALNGYRQQFVDVLCELLDHEPHGYTVLSKLALSLAGGRMELSPAKTAPGSPEAERAKQICDEVTRQFERIPRRTQAFASLAWSLFYGVGALENDWEKTGRGWEVQRLRFIHSRRLSYPHFAQWDLHVWDMGGVVGFDVERTNQFFGLRIADYPGKFLVHTPQVRADYPTREGLGRILLTYFAIKRLVMRVSAQDFERFIKPWVIAYYSTIDATTGKPRLATDDDILAGDRAVKALGAGALAGVTLPDSLRIELLKKASELSQDKFLEYLDLSISKVPLGQTFTTQPGAHGNRSAASEAKNDTLELMRYHAQCLADSIEEGLVLSIVTLNFPGEEHLTPTLKIHVEERPDPSRVMDIAVKGAQLDMPVDQDKLAQQVGLPLVAPDDTTSRRVRLVKASEAAGDEGTDAEPRGAEGGAAPAGDGAPEPNDDEPSKPDDEGPEPDDAASDDPDAQRSR